MIPEKGKKYTIACLGPYEYCQYRGGEVYSGRMIGAGSEEDPYLYCFDVPELGDLYFTEEDIISEIIDSKTEQSDSQKIAANTEYQLNALQSLLRDCVICKANVDNNTITVKINAPNSVSGVVMGEKAKILF
jgi:hypothetical protein